jgi:hypothetical protein
LVAEQDLGSCASGRGGSSPFIRTTLITAKTSELLEVSAVF